MQCTKIILSMDVFIAALHQQDFDSMAKDRLSSTRPLYLPLECRYLKLSPKNNTVWLYNIQLHQRHAVLKDICRPTKSHCHVELMVY